MAQERKVAISTESLVGDETLYLRYAPLLAKILILKSAGVLTHLDPSTSVGSFGGLILGDGSLSAISSVSVADERGLSSAQYSVGLVHGARKRKVGEVAARQIPILVPTEMLKQLSDYSPTERKHNAMALEYLKNKVLKITPELFLKYSIRTQEDLDQLLKSHSATGFCYDVIESKFLVGSTLLEWVMRRTMIVAIPVFKDPIDYANYGLVNRIALGNDLISGDRCTQILKHLREIDLAGFQGVYVLSFDLSKLPGITDFIAYPKDIKNAVKPLVAAIKNHA